MLKIGVLGAESSVGIKLQALKELKESAIAGIFDNNFKKASELAQIYEINAFDSFKNLLDAVDALYLSEPLPFLYELTVEAIKNSKHLFIGNPMNISVHEALSLLKLSEEAHLKIQVGFPERFNSAYMAARAYFNNPMFIETHRLSMFNAATAEIPVVLELMVHDIDIIVSAIKSNVKKISASGVAIISNTYDIANARIEFDNGCVANLTASRISLHSMAKSRFFQKDAYMTVDFINNCVNIIRIRGNDSPDPLLNTIKIGDKEVYFEKPDVKPGYTFKDEMASFCNSIFCDTKPFVNIEDFCNTLQVADKILEKMKLTSNCS